MGREIRENLFKEVASIFQALGTRRRPKQRK